MKRRRKFVFDLIIFNKEVNDLIRNGDTKRAEKQMLEVYSALQAANSVYELEAVACRLAHFYSMPDTENLEKAESYVVERERLLPGAYTKCQTATFYFSVLADFAKTVRKVDEIKQPEAIADRSSDYSASVLKGQALIKLERTDEA